MCCRPVHSLCSESCFVTSSSAAQVEHIVRVCSNLCFTGEMLPGSTTQVPTDSVGGHRYYNATSLTVRLR
jgi:hypothetical protein